MLSGHGMLEDVGAQTLIKSKRLNKLNTTPKHEEQAILRLRSPGVHLMLPEVPKLFHPYRHPKSSKHLLVWHVVRILIETYFQSPNKDIFSDSRVTRPYYSLNEIPGALASRSLKAA